MIFDLHNKDCLEILPTIPDKSVDLIFCDLPYGQTNCKWDSLIDIDKLWVEFKRIRKNTTPIIMCCTTKFGVSLINSNPKEFKFDMVWQKSRKLGFLQARKRPMVGHEMVYFFYKKQCKYNYLKYHTYTKKQIKSRTIDKKLLKVYTHEDVLNKPHRKVIDKGTGSYEPILPDSVIVNDENPKCLYRSINDDGSKAFVISDGTTGYNPKLPDSILKIASKKPSKHSTGKPLELMEFILKYWTDEGDIVFDPTFGGGSMPIQCKIMKRQFIGCEMDKQIYDDAVKLINTF